MNDDGGVAAQAFATRYGDMELYRCNHVKDLWQRQIGCSRPNAFVRHIGGSQDLICRLELHAKLNAHEGCVNTVQFNPSGNLLVSGSDDRRVIFWDWAAKTKVFEFYSGHTSNVFQAKIMPFTDDRSIVTCAADGQQVRHAQVLENGRVDTKWLAEHRGRTHKLALEPGSSCIFYSCGEDGVVQRFDLRCDSATKLSTCRAFRGNNNKSRSRSPLQLNAITINPRNPVYFAIGGSDVYARVYDIRYFPPQDASWDKDCPVDTFSPEHLIDNRNVHITGLAYSNQNELLVSYNDELIYLFERGMSLGSNPKLFQKKDDMESPQVYKGHRNAETVKGVNFFGPNTEYVVSGSDCGRIFIWKKIGGELVHLMRGDDQVVNCLEPHPYATILATSGIDKDVKVWMPTAESVIPLPEDLEEILEANRQGREERPKISLTPDVIMRVLRLQRRQSQQNAEGTYSMEDFENEDDDGHEYVFLQPFLGNGSDDDDDNDDDAHMNPQECIIN